MSKKNKPYSKTKLREFKNPNSELQDLVEKHRKRIADQRRSKMKRKPRKDNPYPLL